MELFIIDILVGKVRQIPLLSSELIYTDQNIVSQRLTKALNDAIQRSTYRQDSCPWWPCRYIFLYDCL